MFLHGATPHRAQKLLPHSVLQCPISLALIASVRFRLAEARMIAAGSRPSPEQAAYADVSAIHTTCAQ